MLHRELMFRFEDPDLGSLREGGPGELAEQTGVQGGLARAKLIASVCGNVLLGGALLGGLLLVPHLLARVLGLG